MALTNFMKLSDEQVTVWSKELWMHARNHSFLMKFAGGTNSIVQRVTELTKKDGATRAIIQLVPELEGDGVVGDARLEDNEEAMRSYQEEIRFDMIRHANRNEGRMADQSEVINFREQSRDKLGYWLADRLDQLGFLTMTGVSYGYQLNGKTRIGSQFPTLSFARDLSAPTDRRRARWNGTTKKLEIGGATTDITTADTPSWELFVQLKAYAQEAYVRGLKGTDNNDTYHVFLTPTAMARLKLDPTFMLNVRHAQGRSDDNPLFSGGSIKIDNIVFNEHRHVFNTSGAVSGAKWGSLGAVDGCAMLFCGAQALAVADIGDPFWNEEEFDYGNSHGIAVGKFIGMLKPKFVNQRENHTEQDFGVIVVYVAQ